MIFGIVSADQSVPPATGNACTQGLSDSLQAYINEAPDVGTFVLHLDTSGTNIVEDTALDVLTEPVGGGYAPAALSVAGGPFTDQYGSIYYLFGGVLIIPTASLTDVTGWFVTAAVVGGVAATATATEAGGSVTGTTVTLGGGPYAIPPAVTFSASPTPSETARGHAVLTGGAVTSIVVDYVGAAYVTAPTITIAPPENLQGGGTFEAAIPWVPGAAFPLTVSCYAAAVLPPAAG